MLKLSGISFDVIPSDLEGSIDTSDDWSAIAAIIGDADQAIDAANSAAENANTVAQTVQDKLDNGELKGEPGESGTINDTTVTTFEGLLKGSGGKVAAAVAGDDYVTPSQLETDVFKLIYPVGSIYLSVNSANPSSVFPGTTWVAWGAGRVPVGVSSGDADFGSVEKTGGEKSVALNSSQVPTSTVNTFLDIYDAFSPAMTENSSTNYGTVAYLKDRNQGTVTGTVAGGSQAHSNLQPYITCYMWKRTA